jgi:hypothetical protein
LIDRTTGITTSHEFSRVPLFLVNYIVPYSPEEAAKLAKDVVGGLLVGIVLARFAGVRAG